jgi:hypothetical protein
MSKTALGPWQSPTSDILDGAEAIVMKAAEFTGNRRLLVGFVQDKYNQYGGDLLFRELVQQSDGSLGTRLPKEMEFPVLSHRSIADAHLDASHSVVQLPDLGEHAQITATIRNDTQSAFAVAIGSAASMRSAEQLVFDPKARTVGWIGSMGVPGHARLDDVTDLTGPVTITLTLYGTLADLSINGHRTLIHRLPVLEQPHISFIDKGVTMDISGITESVLK